MKLAILFWVLVMALTMYGLVSVTGGIVEACFSLLLSGLFYVSVLVLVGIAFEERVKNRTGWAREDTRETEMPRVSIK